MNKTVKYLNGETMSLANLIDLAIWVETNALNNNKNLDDIPVVVSSGRYQYPLHTVSFGYGSNGMIVSLGMCDDKKLMPVVEDKRPNGEKYGEYWRSRGSTDHNVSGFVVSKEAGERLDRLVKLVLEKNETESWLDYRDYEPEWIQYKFSAKEFNVEKLSELSEENNGVINLDILEICKK